MLLHACLLLFIITTDNTLALSHHRCGGNVSLDEEPAGHINLTLPGLSGDNPSNKQSDKTPLVPVCTWMIDIPRDRMVLLKLEWLEIGSRISVQCFGNEENRVLEVGGAVLLSGCDRDKASISWTGAGRSSRTIQLSYSVHEDRRNSSLDQSTPHSSQDLGHGSQTGTIVTEKAPIGHEVLKGRERGRGYFYEVLKEWTSMPPSVSSPSSEIQGLLHASSTLQGLSMAVRADRETTPLPEEEPNNQPETSGAAHLTDGPVSAKERTHHYFQHTFTTGSSFHTSHSTNTENTSGEPNQTQMALKHETASSSDIMLDTDSQKLTVTQTSKLSISSQAYPSVPSSRVPKVTSSLPELSSRTTWDSSTMVSAQSGSPGEKLPPRSQRSTDMVNLDIMSIVTSDPLNSQTEQQQGNSSGPYTTNVSSSSSPGPSRSHSSTTYITELDTDISTMEATSFHPNISQSDSIVSTASDRTNQTSVFESFDESQSTERLHTFPSSPQTQTNFPERIEKATHSPLPHTTSLSTQTGKEEAQTATQRYFPNASMAKNTIPFSPDFTMVDDRTFPGSSTGRAAQTFGDEVHNSATTGSSAGTQTYSQHHTRTLFHDYSPKNSPRPPPHVSSSPSIHSSISSYRPQTRTAFSASSQLTPTSLSSPSTTPETPVHRSDVKAIPTATIEPASLHTPLTQPHLPLPSTTAEPAIDGKSHTDDTNTQTSLLHLTTTKSDQSPGQVDTEKEEKDDKYFQWLYSSTPTQPPTTGLPPQKPPPGTIPHPSQKNHTTPTSVLTSTPMWSTATSQTPKFYIVPDEPAAIKVESINLLLQIIVEESGSAFTVGLEEDTAAWVEPYLQRAPGFSKLLGAWSSGHAVQSLVEFKTSVALQWLGMTGPKSLLEQTGLAQAVRDGRKFRLSKVINVTLGGLQGDVCDWLLQCEAGYRCVFQPGTSNYACSSKCHFDHCHHHGICTHHPSQLPVCRCLVGEDFWYMGQRCDMRMTQPWLVGTCLAILLIIVTVIGVLAFVAVRRYRAILIQAKVDQTRSSYRRFNHFDELSGRFWLRSWAGSADSLENSAYIRSNELLNLRTLDRPCCYHDDTLSLASTCPSHGARINTVYLHSSQYGWRGSEMSMGEGVLDSGKASDLSVCSWPVEPIHWTPFPLLQQLASHRTPTVRISRPRSYCEGMELVDLGKSWTA